MRAARIFVLCGFCIGCCGGAAVAEPIRVLVSVPPHGAFVEQIGQDRVAVEILIPPGQNPHTYSPSAQQVRRLSRCRVYFRTGMPFETPLLRRLTTVAPGLEVVDVRVGLDLRQAGEATCEEALGSHDGTPGHVHGEFDPHIWLSPILAKKQVHVIADKLVAIDPGGAEFYRRNRDQLVADLERLDRELATRLAPFRGRNFLVYHPAYGYFADTYHLRQVAVEIGGKQPTGRQLARVIEQARAEQIRLILVQPQFSPRHAETVAAAIDGAVIVVDPLRRDYRSCLETIAAAIEKAMR